MKRSLLFRLGVRLLIGHAFFVSTWVLAEAGLEAKGVCYLHRCNPINGKVWKTDTNLFRCVIIERGYWLSVTNPAINREGVPWRTEIKFDGVDSFHMYLKVETKVSDRGTFSMSPVKSLDQVARIFSGPYFHTQGLSLGAEDYLWWMYCFSPMRIGLQYSTVTTNQIFTERSVFLTGWRYEFIPTRCGNFITTLRMVRDSRLDLPDWHDEMLRPGIDVPQTIEEWNMFFELLEDRKVIPDGFVRLEYECKEVLNTNGWTVPLVGIFRRMRSPSPGSPSAKVPLEIVEVRAISISVGNDFNIDIGPVQSRTEVYDYRYRRMKNDRIFNCAKYTLEPGEGFRGANDPELLAQAERALRRGRKYYEPPVSGKHKVLWVVAVLLAVPPVVYLLYRWRSGRSVRG